MKTMRKLISIVLTLALCTSLAAPALALSFDDVQEAIEWEREERDDRDDTDDAAEDDKSEDSNTNEGDDADEDDKSEDSNTNEGDDADDDKSDESTANEGEDNEDDKSDETEANADVNEDEEPEEPEDEEPVQKTDDGSLILGTDDRYGFKWNKDSSKFGIEAWDTETEDEEGNKTTVRNIKLNEDVKYDAEKDKDSIVVNKDKNVNLDLNGNDIDGGNRESNSALITVKGGDLTIQDSTAKVDEDGKYVSGEITNNNVNQFGAGGGVTVTGGGSLTLDSGAITDNTVSHNGGGVYVDNGKVTINGGQISGNEADLGGGGVFLNQWAAGKNEASLTMNGGAISNNTSNAGGGGLWAYNQFENTKHSTVELNGGEISGNHAASDGGGVYIGNAGATINGTTISGNTAKNGAGFYIAGNSDVTIEKGDVKDNEATIDGGGIYTNNQAKVTMNGGAITSNHAGNGGGGILMFGQGETFCATFIMNGGLLYQNTADKHSDDAYKGAGATLILPVASSMGVNATDGKAVSGWYFDTNGRWETGKYPYASQDQTVSEDSYGKFVGSILYLKAAHDEYFKVTFTDGVDGSVFGNRTKEAENNTGIPAFGESYDEVPTREGYVFIGWLLDDEDVDLENGIVNGEMTLVAQWEAIPQEPDVDPDEPDVPDTPDVDPDEPDVPDTPVVDPEEPEVPDIEDEDVPLTGEPDDDDDDDDDGEPVEAEDVEIEDELVPLAAGPVTRAEFVDYLWQHEGEPAPVADSGLFADVTAEHEYSPAIAWAKSINIIEGYEDDTFAPDELVTVAAVRSILTRFAAYAGMDVDVSALVSLTGEDDAVVMNCDAVLAEFFGEETEA